MGKESKNSVISSLSKDYDLIMTVGKFIGKVLEYDYFSIIFKYFFVIVYSAITEHL